MIWPFAVRHWREVATRLQTRSGRVLLKSKPSILIECSPAESADSKATGPLALLPPSLSHSQPAQPGPPKDDHPVCCSWILVLAVLALLQIHADARLSPELLLSTSAHLHSHSVFPRARRGPRSLVVQCLLRSKSLITPVWPHPPSCRSFALPWPVILNTNRPDLR
jgi:hypothetical protein